ncbi:hypothetical protein YC2023_030512 [Brassica napus]
MVERDHTELKTSLIVYPNGYRQDSGSGFISLYVAIDNSTLVEAHQEVFADLRFYVFKNNERKYFTIQGSFGLYISLDRKNMQCVYRSDIYLYIYVIIRKTMSMHGDTIFSKRCGDSLRSSLLLPSETRATDTFTMKITASLLGTLINRGSPGPFGVSPRWSEIRTSLIHSPWEEGIGGGRTSAYETRVRHRSLLLSLISIIPKRVIDLEREIRSGTVHVYNNKESFVITPNIFTCNLLVKALCKKNDVESAYKVLDEIPEMGLVPNLVTYTTILL